MNARNINNHRNADARVMVGKTVYENRRVYRKASGSVRPVVYYHWSWVPVDEPYGFYPY